MYRKSNFVYMSSPLCIGYAQIFTFIVHITPNMHFACACCNYIFFNTEVERYKDILNKKILKNLGKIIVDKPV